MKSVKNKIVIGAWSLSGDLGKIDKKQIFKTIEYCIQNNLKEFDIAPTYGFGLIDKIFSKDKNYDLKINTKIGYDKNRKKNFSINVLKKSVEKSLKFHNKINTIFLHNPRYEITNWYKVIDFLNNLKKQELVKNIGISLARDFYFSSKILNRFDFVQDEVNLLRASHLSENKNKFKFMARSPLATGILSKNFNENRRYYKNDYRFRWLRGSRKKNIIKQKKLLIKIFGNNLTTVSYSYLFFNKNIDKIIFGLKNVKQVKNLLEFKNLKKINLYKIKQYRNLYDKKFGFSDNDEVY